MQIDTPLDWSSITRKKWLRSVVTHRLYANEHGQRATNWPSVINFQDHTLMLNRRGLPMGLATQQSILIIELE